MPYTTMRHLLALFALLAAPLARSIASAFVHQPRSYMQASAVPRMSVAENCNPGGGRDVFRIDSTVSNGSVMSRRAMISTAATMFSIAGAAAPAFALRDPSGATTGGGKYDQQMDPLTATAMYGTGKAQIEARKAIRAQGGKVPTPR